MISGWGTNPIFYTTQPKINKNKQINQKKKNQTTNIETEKIMLKELREDQLHEGGVKA